MKVGAPWNMRVWTVDHLAHMPNCKQKITFIHEIQNNFEVIIKRLQISNPKQYFSCYECQSTYVLNYNDQVLAKL